MDEVVVGIKLHEVAFCDHVKVLQRKDLVACKVAFDERKGFSGPRSLDVQMSNHP
jgi:hypothetical protein